MKLLKRLNLKKRGRLKLIGWIVVGLLALILFSSVVYSGFTERTTHLSAYSDKWNDISEFRESVEDIGYNTASIISSPAMLLEVEEPEKTLFIAIGVERSYTATEARIIYDFVRDGGKAVIADDYGYANSVSEYYFGVTYIGHRLWDQEYEKNPKLVKIDIDPTTSAGFYFDGNILFNNPTALISSIGTLASSTNLSWVDENNDNLQNIDEISQPYPVVVKKYSGDGSIVFISDPSMFINDMWGREKNSDFTMALVQHMIETGGEVIFDESRHIRENPVDNSRQSVYEALVILTTDDQLRWLTAIITVLVLGLLIIAYDNPFELKHIYNVGKFKGWELKEPWLSNRDTDRLRFIFLERLRIHLGLSMEEFRDLTRQELNELIGEPELSAFALDMNKYYSSGDLGRIFMKIKQWPEAGPGTDEPMQAIELDDDHDHY